MPTYDWTGTDIIPNGSGSAVRADLNDALLALFSQNSSATAPPETVAYMPWADTSTGLYKIRNGANSGWITLYQLDGEWTTIALESGTAAAPSLYFKDSGTDTGLYSPGTDQVAIATAGVQRVNFNGSTEVVFNDGGADVDFRIEGDTEPNLFKIDAGTDQVQVANLNGGPISGTRNRIINGSLDVWQRGTSTTAIGNTYLADRWQSAFATGGTVSQETTSLPAGSRYAWKFVASASNSFMQMGQQIEYLNCLDLQNATVTISFMARSVNSNAGSTALTVRTRTIAGIDGACIFAGSNTDSSVTLTTTWARYTVTRTLPATFGSLSLEFALGSHVSGDGIMLSQIQLEPGTVATPFERRSYGQELALCQRYYSKSFPAASGFPSAPYYDGNMGWGQSIETAKVSMSIRFPVEMRATPTVTIYSPTTLTAGTFRVWQAGVDRTGGAGFISTTGFASIDKSGAADLGPSSTQNSAVHWIASIEL